MDLLPQESIRDLAKLLSVGLAWSTHELAEGIVDGSYASDVVACLSEVGQGNVGTAFSDLLSAFGSDTTSETVRQELAYVYTKLFLVPRGIVISPVESVYRQRKAGKPEMVIMTATALDVEGYYGRFGMAGMRGEPSDKIETELEFASLLLHHHTEGNVGVRGEEPLVTLKGFYFDHLSQWVPDYCAELTEKSDNDFFRALSEALKALMWSLQHLLIELGGSPSSATPAGRANRRARRHSRHGSKSDAKRTGGAPLATSLLIFLK